LSLLVWDAKYMLGIAEVDRQHQKLFALVNELNAAIQDGQGDHVAAKVLVQVLDYTVHHFAYEDKLFRQYGYSDQAVHRAEHGRLADQTKALMRAVEARQTDVSVATLKFLSGWLSEHILDSDRDYAKFLIARGVH
jgi:hemerythrin